MAEYDYPDDGKIHTRYSELKRCGGVQGAMSAVEERLNMKQQYGGAVLGFGHERHKMWEEESKKTGLSPACFLEPPCSFQMPVSHVEAVFTCEPIPGVVLHSTMDLVSKDWKIVADNKTVHGTFNTYQNSKQLLVYALNLAFNNIPIERGIYLMEVWNEERDAIIGYDKIEQEITMTDIKKIYDSWLKPRCRILAATLNEYKNR